MSTPNLYPTPDHPQQQQQQQYPLYPNANVPVPTAQTPTTTHQPYTAPPFDPHNFSIPSATCTLISPDHTTAPLGQGPLIIVTSQNTYPASPTLTLAIAGWEIHLPISSAMAQR
ncbi:hypothetical protein HK097_005195, partial [Rhizophlyctis rosea]